MTLLLMLLFKSLLVLALSGMVLVCLRRASASARHLVCLLTLCGLLALPLFSVTLPGWHVAVTQAQERKEPTPVRPSPALPAREGEEAGPEAISVPAAPSLSESSLTERTPAKQEGGFSWPFLLLAFYLLGVTLAALRPLLGLWGIAHLRRTCVDVPDAPARGVLADCAAALKLKRLPRLCRADVPVPMTWGWRRPVVLLPLGSGDWPEGRLHSVLLHEMAHVKRRDWPSHRLADLACAVYWFHPFVWLTARRLRAESEIACDDLVLASGIPAPDYARHLLDIAQALPPASRPPQSAAIAMAQTPHIKRRILMVLDTAHSRRTVTRRALTSGVVLTAAALMPLSMLQPTAKAQDASAPAQSFSNGVVQLIGITDRTSLGGKGWDANGKKVSVQVANSGQREALVGSAKPGQKIVFFALHSTPPLQDDNIVFHDTASGDGYQWPISSHAALFAETFPAPLLKTTFQVGVTSGLWCRIISTVLVRLHIIRGRRPNLPA